MTRSTADLVVVGAGVIGAAIAWLATTEGRRVTLVDPAVRSGASWVAGGMLAPVTEAWPGEEGLLELGSRSLRHWPEFAARLAAAGRDPGLRTEGTVVAAVDAADRAELVRTADFLAGRGRDVALLTSREVRRLEPALGPGVRAGLHVPGDLAVDNRACLDALLHAAGAAEHVAEPVLRVGPGRVELAGGRIDCAQVVLAAGAWSGRLHPALAELIRPVKGEILRLRARPGSLPPPARTVRGLVQGRHVYLVPRDEAGLVVGATQYEAGFDTEPRVAGVRDLLADAEALVPGLADYALVEAAAGLRPGSVDNLPVLRWLEPGVLAATGHGRNGMLLAPVTAYAALALLRGQEPEWTEVADESAGQRS
jgi:glycine oxidase